ncbi:aminotransferase class III-fold pyridoxal phosphate-dependent enzyme [Kitasatospora sp. NPDC050543]|uniref:aminotransferase class III-fold pyridoxal phosphate-dependent enzyme n=1 Tax=Kitasatospora sp. NPDC050543 TaxID=3364054 RepID=UPI0037892BE2
MSGLKWRLGGAGHLTGIRPDLTCWGKGIGGGLPLSTLTGGRDLMQLGDHARPRVGQPPLFLLTTTHGADTASLAAMVATVTEMATTDAIGRAHATGTELRGMVNAILAEAGVEQSVRLADYDCFLNIETAGPGLKALFLQEAIRAGALVRGIFYPTAAHTAEHVEQTAVAVRRAAQACGRALTDGAGADLLPAPAQRPL